MISDKFKSDTKEAFVVILGILGFIFSVFLFAILATGLFKLFLLWVNYISLFQQN